MEGATLVNRVAPDLARFLKSHYPENHLNQTLTPTKNANEDLPPTCEVSPQTQQEPNITQTMQQAQGITNDEPLGSKEVKEPP